MTLFIVFLCFLAVVSALVDLFRLDSDSSGLAYFRYYSTIGAISIAFVVAATMAGFNPAWLGLAVVAVLPLIYLAVCLVAGRRFQRVKIIAVTALVTVIPLLLSLIANQWMMTFVILLATWPWLLWLLFYLIEPSGYFVRIPVSSRTRFWSGVVLVGAIPAFLVLWALMTQLMVFQASRIATNGSWCIAENDGTRHQHTLWLSPRRILLGSPYTELTSPHLLMTPDGRDWSHHWSFWSMNFVENETGAFKFSGRILNPDQGNLPC